ncbi:unnamed protein product [Euphydryas editha]|uniref:Uncharacterized protein n=1 Tax=Euphydryas editha TaxID=104508 RepID=A0AAU9TYP4_EUPED|nr:unnamed protein product [Euphydryas editha]
MCKRRKQGGKQKERQKKKRRARKTQTCCQKCRRKICNWLCRKIKRCIKKKVFGIPDPQLDDFEIGGINLGSVRDNLKINKSEKSLKKDTEISVVNKPTIITLFRKKQNKYSKSNPIKNAIINEYDRYSVSKSIGSKVKSFINDFKERNLYLDVSKDSKLGLNKDEKESIRKLAKKYGKESYENLKKRFLLTASKSVLFRNMINDYKKGNFSLHGLKNKNIKDLNNLNSQDFNRLLVEYESQKKNEISDRKSRGLSMFKNVDSKYKKISIKNLELVKDMKSYELKNKFSLSKSKQKILGNMIDDYKKGKISLSAMRRDVNKDLRVINKENLNVMLDYYKRKKSSIHVPIIKQSKLKQIKSDFREKIASLEMFTNNEAIAMVLLAVIRCEIKTESCTCSSNDINTQNEPLIQKMKNIEITDHVTEKKRKRCCPYNYDGKLCRAVGDRVLCGYNRNIGGPENREGDIELKNGCRIRKGRLECGYNQPPFLNSRRPPVYDYAAPEEVEKTSDVDVPSKEEKVEKLSYKSTNMPRLTTRCLEIKERIVCRKV